jgi:small subunit ribosomal protein S18e
MESTMWFMRSPLSVVLAVVSLTLLAKKQMLTLRRGLFY